MQKIYIFVKNPLQKFVRTAQWRYLCNVFHGIRFKVNKGWDSAEPLFFCLFVRNHLRFRSFFRKYPRKSKENGDAGKIKDEKHPHSCFFVVSLQVIALTTTASVPDEQGIRTRYQAACAMLKTLTNNI